MKTSIVIPVHNAQTTLSLTLSSLFKQAADFTEVIIVDDASTDRTPQIINRFRHRYPQIKVFRHPVSLGLASSYNTGIKASRYPIIITLHADIILKPKAIKLLCQPLGQPDTVATFHRVIHPRRLWLKYNLWQKCLFSRLVAKSYAGLDGKFDAFKKTALTKAGLFDHQTYKRAGEDGDIIIKLKQIGRIEPTFATIIHLHDLDPKFSLSQLVRKHAQYAQAQGALLRRHGLPDLIDFVKMFFRELLLLGLLIPHLNYLALVLVIIYCLVYTKNVYQSEFPNPRLLLLPFVNFYLLLVSFYFSLNGYVSGRQTL